MTKTNQGFPGANRETLQTRGVLGLKEAGTLVMSDEKQSIAESSKIKYKVTVT